MADVTERTLALLTTLQTGRGFTGDELAARLGVSPRTVRRDVERLRGYGYPVDTRPGPGGHYRLTAGRTMPPLVLGDDEAVAALLGLAILASSSSGDDGRALDDAATRAYAKLDQFLPKRLRPRVASLRASLETGHHQGPGVDAAVLATMAEAITAHETVTFTYRNVRDEVRSRRVEPHRQVHLHLRWFLFGWDVDRQDWRVFRTDRVTDLTRTGTRFTPRELPAGSAIAYLRAGMNVDRQRVELVVDAPPTRVADALRRQDAELDPLDDQRTRVTLWLDSWEWLLLNLAFLDTTFTVVGPDGFRAACAAFARRVLAATEP